MHIETPKDDVHTGGSMWRHAHTPRLRHRPGNRRYDANNRSLTRPLACVRKLGQRLGAGQRVRWIEVASYLISVDMPLAHNFLE